MKAYLAGPIELIGLDVARKWREDAIHQADAVFTTLELVNPMDYESETGPYHDEEIVNTDKFLISGVDALIVDGRVPGWGTAMELLMAHQAHKLIVVWGIDRNQAPIWLRYHASHFEATLTEALEYLYAFSQGVIA